MVFESIVADLLNKYLGEYVENLDSSQLRIGIWGGDVVLNHLVLKQSALDDLDLPIRTVYGVLEKLVLKIPWKNLYNDKVVATVERLFLLAVPNQSVKYDPVKEERWNQDAKQSQIKKVEEAKKRVAEKDMPKSDDSFVEKLAAQIIKNVEVTISEIHIRYEDSISNLGKPFSLGITLYNLAVHSTDSNWTVTESTDSKNFIFKELKLEGFAVYLNPNSPQFTEKSPEEMFVAFQEGITTRYSYPEGYDYMLGPINATSRLRLNPKPELDGSNYTIPKTELNLDLEKLLVRVTKLQHRNLVMMLDSLDWMARAAPYRKYRPFVSGYRGHYKEWWRFAYKCILEEEVRRRRNNWNWKVMRVHRDMCRSYADLYRQKLTSKKLSPETLLRIDDLESSMDVFNIVLIRQRIEVEVEKDLENQKKLQKERKGWFSAWWGGGAAGGNHSENVTPELAKKIEAVMTPSEKAKLYRAIDYNENATPAIYPVSFVETMAVFRLNGLELKLVNDEDASSIILLASLQQVNFLVEQRNGGQAMKLSGAIKSFTVEGTPQDGYTPMLVRSRLLKDPDAVLLDFLIETNPLDGLCDQRVRVVARPLRICHDACTVNNIIDLMKNPDSTPTLQSKLQAAIPTPALKEMSALGIQYAMEKQLRLDVYVDMMSSHFIIAHRGLFRGEENILVANLGRLTVNTVRREGSSLNVRDMHLRGQTEADIINEMMDRSYSKYSFKMDDIKVIFVFAGEVWRPLLFENKDSPLLLVRPFSFTMDVDKCAVLDDPRLPRVKITATLGDINLDLSEERLLAALNVLNSLPFDASDPTPLGHSDNVSRSSQQSLFIERAVVKTNLNRGITVPLLEPEPPPLVQMTNVHATLVLNHVFIKFYETNAEAMRAVSRRGSVTANTEAGESGEKDWSSGVTKLLFFRLLDLRVDYILCTFDTTLVLKLGLIDLTQHHDGYDVELVGTPRLNIADEFLFTLKYVQVDRKSPNFRTVHKGILKRIDVDFASLNMILHQEAILQLLSVAKSFQTQLDANLVSPESKTTQKSSSRKLQPISEEGESAVEPVHRPKMNIRRKKKSSVQLFDLKIWLKMKCVTAQLVTAARPIASVAICGGAVTIGMSRRATELAVHLDDITVIDMSPRTHFKKVLSYTDEEVFSANVTMNEIVDPDDPSEYDIVVEVRLGCMHIVFVNFFFSTLANFFSNFQNAQKLVIEASAAAALKAKENAKDVYSKATKISLDIELKAPLIVIPVNALSYYGFLLDLGKFTIGNTFEAREVQKNRTAILHTINLTLDDVKLSRILMDEKTLEIISECNVLAPVSLKFDVVRNLAMSWYHKEPDVDVSAQLDSIRIALTEEDYRAAMHVISENLGDVPSPAERIDEPAISPSLMATLKSGAPGTKEETVEEPAPREIYDFVKFAFTMQSLVITLYPEGTVKEPPYCIRAKVPENGMAQFTLVGLSLRGRMQSDGSLSSSFHLVDCLLDDLRLNRHSKIKRFMESKKTQPNPENIPSNISFDEELYRMMAVSIIMNDELMTVNMLVNSFYLILSMEFLLNVKDFFVRGLPQTASAQNQPVKVTPSVYSMAPSQATSSRAGTVIENAAKSPPSKIVKVHLLVEQPDIIMVETMNNDSTNALLFNVQIEFRLNFIEEVMTVSGSLKDLQLYVVSSFPNYSNAARSPVVNPFTIDLNGGQRKDGLKLDVSSSHIHIALTPGTLELLARCYATFQSDQTDNRANVEDVDYSNIWGQRSFSDPEYWFLKTEKAEEAFEVSSEVKDITASPPHSELVMMEFPRIILTVEAGVGIKTLPMILVETNFQGKVKDFSSLMNIESSLSLQISYYNSRLALWEPLVEPVEALVNDQAVHYPWELKMDVEFNDVPTNGCGDESQVSGTGSEDDTDGALLVPRMQVTLSSAANLELTVTKTCLEVMETLSEAFQSAMNSQLAAMTSLCSAPYQVRNHTGLTISLNLETSSFKLANVEDSVPVELVVLESGATIALELLERSDIPSTLISSPSRARVERFLQIQPENISVLLNLPVVRADKRYFSLQQKGDATTTQWGMISDVQVEDGGFIVTLRSIIQILNHFSVPVNVYFMTERGNELESVGTVAPGDKLNLPLRSVYTPTSELFFSVDGYSVSVSPYVWRDLQQSLAMSKLLQCEPKSAEEAEPFFINAVGEMEQVYYENTIRHTMASRCYNVHLRPAVILKNFLPWEITCSVQGVPVRKKLNAGQHLQIPTVEPGSSTVVLTIPDYLEKRWSCKSPVRANPPELSVWVFESFDSVEKAVLNLGMHTVSNDGSMIMALYAPFWMLNKTGLNLTYKHSDEGGAVFFHPANFAGPILLPYQSKDFHAKKKAALKIEDEEWSPNFPLDVAGSSGQVTCKVKGILYQLGVHIELNCNSLTKRVLVAPYYIILNNAQYSIECKEEGIPNSPWIKVDNGDCSPLWPKNQAPDRSLRVRIAHTKEASAPFEYSSVSTVLLKLHNKYGGLNLDVQVTEGAVYLSFTSYEPGLAPALFINHTKCTVRITENLCTKVRNLGPKEALLFAWDKLTGERSISWTCDGSKEMTDALRQDGLGKITTAANERVYWVCFLDGIQRVFLLTYDSNIARDAQSAGDMEAPGMTVTMSIHGVGFSLVNNFTHEELMYIGIASSGAIWETRKISKGRYKHLQAAENTLMEEAWMDYNRALQVEGSSSPCRRIGKYTVDFATMIVSQPSSRSLRRSFQTGLWIDYRVATHQVQIHVKINRIQIDSQMPDAIFPVIFAPVPPPHSVAVDTALKPFLEMSVVKRLTEHSPVQQYKYCKILVQEFHVKVDVNFINAISAFFEAEAISEDEEIKRFNADMDTVTDPLKCHVALQSSAEQKNFYDLLHFSPLKIHVSFSLGEDAGNLQRMPHILSVFLQSVGVTLTDMHDVVFKLAYLEREYVFLTQQQLIAEAKMHYMGQLLKQFYVLVFGLDVIGNPFGLVVGITKGVEDFFYEPIQGAIQGPGEFAKGLVFGVRSLLGHTVGGAAGAASRITSTLGKGLAVLSFDEEYIRKRRENQNKRPANLHTGLAQSGKGLLMGVVDGVTGVVTKPVSGYKEGSWGGMFKGVGKGVAGLITRPTAGIVDFASGSFNAVRRAAEMTEEVTRLRPPRYFQPDGVLRPYTRHEAEGNKILQELEKGRYSTTDVYIHHVFMAHSAGKEILLITDKRIAYLKTNDIFGGWQVDWSYTWTELSEPPSVDPDGVLIVACDQKKKKRLLGGSTNKKVLLIPDEQQRQRMVLKMDELYTKNSV